MGMWLWAVVGGMAVMIAILLVKIHLLQKAAREIEDAFAGRLITDTNTLIDISARDKHMRHLAGAINGELRSLRAAHHLHFASVNHVAVEKFRFCGKIVYRFFHILSFVVSEVCAAQHRL